ncbi:hypothetical protein MNBD_UNCLBAC01-1360 [hydrothermal vent metagenome]|uniref:Uncharacterized protein n=1 Tax=hydrothermal vent metagenome TaxID=652676 RepID=A0A3B1DPQ5_9ZZZZ
MKYKSLVKVVIFVFLLTMFWKAPEIMASQEKVCALHQASVTECFICDPKLREPGRLWCKEHVRYENRCFLCHPEIKEEDRLWCEEHNLYEDECIFCHPELRKTQNKSEKNVKASTSKELYCQEHEVAEKECGICHPELAETLKPGQGLKIRFESAESTSKAGVITDIPSFGKSPAGLSVLSRVSYNQNSLVRITPLAAGVVQKVFVDVGDDILKGQLLVEIVSPEIARAKSDYLSALANEKLKELVFKREKGLVEKKITSQQEYEQALADYQMSTNTAMMTRQQLLNYGLTEEQIQEVEKTRSSSSTLQVLAPFSGTLIERNAVIGEAAKPGDMLFSLVDLTSMWLELSIPEDSLHALEVGDSVEATFNALPEAIVRGQLTWLSSSIDEQSRMMKARALVVNNGALLKHGMFGQVKILPKRNLEGLQVPVAALQRFNGNPFIFVKLASDLYEIRRVELGAQNNEIVEIVKGVLPHEEVVVTHSFTIKSEFLKSRLGAGCVDE